MTRAVRPMLAVGVSLAAAIAEIEKERQALAGIRDDVEDEDWKAYRDRRAKAIEELIPRLARTAGAVIKDDWDGASIRCAGVRSTSTSGVEGALNNWLVAARKKGVAG